MNRPITDAEREGLDMLQRPLEMPNGQAVAIRESDSIMAVISRAASDPNTDVNKLERLLQIWQGLNARQAEQEFNAAMTAAQKDMRPVAADASNPQTHSEYASYAALDRVLRPIYTNHGFALSFNTAPEAPENYVRVQCLVSHESGFSRTYSVDMPADGKGAKGGDVMTKTHAVGSALSYGARYLLKLIFNVAVGDSDDDGNGAGNAGARIDETELRNVQALIERTGTDIEAFCKYFKVAALPDITKALYPRVCQALNDKERKAKK